jgi:hypothetical protein
LVALLPRLAALGRAEQAMEAARAIEAGWYRAEALAALVPHLGADLLPIALETAQTIRQVERLSQPLVALSQRLASLGRGEQALETARSIEDGWHRGMALAALAPHLGADLLPDALKTARAIEGELQTSAVARAAFGRVEEALVVVRGIWYTSRPAALTAVAPYLGPDHLPTAMDVARGIVDHRGVADKWLQDEALVALMPRLAASGRAEEVWELARGFEYDSDRARALAALAPHLGADLLPTALEMARAIRLVDHRTEALAALAPHLGADLLPIALEMARPIDEWYRVQVLAALAPHLGADLLPDALNAALAIEHRWRRARALAALAPHLGPNLLPIALEMTRAIGDTQDRTQLLAKLGPRPREAPLRRALSLSRAIGDAWHRVRARASRLAPVGRPERALSAARMIKDESRRAKAISALAPDLSPQLLPTALETAQAIRNTESRTKAIVALLPRLAALGRGEEALNMARAIEYWPTTVEIVAALAPHLSADLLPDALQWVGTIGGEWYRVKALAALAPHLGAVLIPDALRMARTIEDERLRADALVALAPRLGADLLPDALEAARAIKDARHRTCALAALASPLAKIPRELLLPVWKKTLDHSATRLRSDLLSDLSALAPVIAALGGPEAIEEACRAIEDVGRWWP